MQTVRALWGNNTDPDSYRYKKIISDIAFVKSNKYEMERGFTTFVYGRNNFELLKKEGFKDLVLMDDRDIIYDLKTQQFKHKLDILVQATKIYDDVLFLDWDTLQIKPTTQQWRLKFQEKASIQAILKIYHRRKALWRIEHLRKIPCGAYMYVRGEKIALEFIKNWEELNRPWSEEVVMAYYTDKVMGKFDVDTYNKLFEPSGFDLNKNTLTTDYVNPICFQHFNSKEQRLIHKNKVKPDWMNNYINNNFINAREYRSND